MKVEAEHLNSAHSQLRIGDVFTPTCWGEFAIQVFGIFEQWMQGASIFDPTMGEGHLLHALVSYGQSKGYTPEQMPLHQLFGNEIHLPHYQTTINSFLKKYNKDLSANFWNQDLLKLPPRPFDILLGNPPWKTFQELPPSYKETAKAGFLNYDLVENKKDLLLGRSRIDLAALIVQKSMKDFLKHKGKAYFFLPLSLFLNDGASEHFRNYQVHDISYAPIHLYDFYKVTAFEGITTRYGLVQFNRDESPAFPIPYWKQQNGTWQQLKAQPLLHPQAPLSVLNSSEKKLFHSFEPIKVCYESRPRQGINTCGANSTFFFETHKPINGTHVLMNGEWKLPLQFIFPVLTANSFQEKRFTAQKWVLLPYHHTGKPLSPSELSKFPLLEKYLKTQEKKLKSRKGVLIRSWIKKGYWWALMGVGPYSFMPYKVVWEAYGRSSFKPIVVKGNWQANQALQAFIPVKSKKEAGRICHALKHPAVEAYLHSLNMAGTMNWAQPGKIKKLLKM